MDAKGGGFLDYKCLLPEDLKNIVDTKSTQEVFDYMEKNMVYFFSTPDIPIYYRILRNVDFSISQSLMPRIMMAWMAFLSGDNANLFLIMKDIRETELNGPCESSMLYALKAMVGYIRDPKEGMQYAKLSIDILSKEQETFYTANAKLTYGQLLASSDQYRQAAEMFASSEKIFYENGLHFLSVVAMVNEVLNRYKIGEFDYVIDKCSEALMMASSYKEEMQSYWNLVHLPLGMCYYELNKPNLAIEHLKLAKESIDKFELFHLHGLIEIYLYKSYYILSDSESMETIKGETIANFEHMHYRGTDLIISMFRIFLMEYTENNGAQSDIEKFELEYFKNGADSHSIVIDSLAYLKLKGLSDTVSIEDIEKRLENLKYIGFIPGIQLSFLQLAELYLLEDKQREAASYLKEAVRIYKEFGISASFYTLPLKSVELLQKIDLKLYNALSRTKQKESTEKISGLLSDREREIMGLIALGKTNEEIGRSLFISVGTIKWHINHILSKLEVKNRVQAIEKAKSLGEI